MCKGLGSWSGAVWLSTEVSGQCLLDVGYDISHILYAYGKADEVGGHPCFAQLLVSELAVCMTCRVEYTCTRIGHMCDYGDEFQPVHEFDGIFS